VSFTGATLTTTNPLWTDLGQSPVLRSERPVGGCLSRGKTLGRKQSRFNGGAPTIPEGPRKTTKTLSTVCAPSEVRTRQLPNTNQEQLQCHELE